MVDQSYIEEIKRRNAERAAKLKESLKIGDFSKLAPPSAEGEPPGAIELTPKAGKVAGPPPPPTARPAAAGPPPPPPPPRGEPARPAPPPPRERVEAPPPVSRTEEPAAPVVPGEGIWDEILGEAVAAVPEEMPSPLDTGPSTSELEEFKVPLFDTSRIEEEEVEEEEVVAAAVEEPEGITDEFVVPAFDSGDTTAAIEEEYAVPAFDSSKEAIAEPEPLPEEEIAAPAYASATEVEEPLEEYAVSAAPEAVEGKEAAPAEVEVPVIAPTSFDNYVILEVKGTELRLRRRNISLREAVSLFEVALEECRKLLEE